MSGIDFLKILLCICGFDRHIIIKTYRGDNNVMGYEISAEDKTGRQYYTENCEGLLFNLENIINCRDEKIHSDLIYMYDLLPKDLINDKKREALISELKN